MHHGHNDHGISYYNDSYNQIKQVPSNMYDRLYYIGAASFIFQKILNDNPFARICIIGHYENDVKTEVSEAQMILGDIWGIPVYDLWNHSQISQRIITVNGTQHTVRRHMIQDDLHPHTTPACNEMIARNIAAWINSSIR